MALEHAGDLCVALRAGCARSQAVHTRMTVQQMEAGQQQRVARHRRTHAAHALHPLRVQPQRELHSIQSKQRGREREVRWSKTTDTKRRGNRNREQDCTYIRLCLTQAAVVLGLRSIQHLAELLR